MVSVEEELGKEPEGGPALANPGTFVPIQFDSEDPYGSAYQRKPKKVGLFIPIAVVVMGMLGAAVVAAFMSKQSKAAAPGFQDLGAGISNATGLKGKLQVRWQSGAQYQVKVEPINLLQSAGFSFVAANPRPGMSITVRILDATGYALCTKEIFFSPAGSDGEDVFQDTKGDTGKVIALNAQGVLPCTAEQFTQANYWDFNTNFPTLAEQQQLMRQSAAARARRESEQRIAQHRLSSAFFAEGDDGAVGYESEPKVLETRMGRSFLVARIADQTAASAWAANNSLFHYKCDQHSRCALTRSGGGPTIYVTAMQ